MEVDKHKVWLILGISITIVAILFLFLYSPVKGAMFGKASESIELDSCSSDEDCDIGGKCTSSLCKYETSCENGIDDNANSLMDCQDPQCNYFPACKATGGVSSKKEICNNIKDNQDVDDDGDGLANCADSDCLGFVGQKDKEWICDGKKKSVCRPQVYGQIRNVGFKFDALCLDSQWYECDADNEPERKYFVGSKKGVRGVTHEDGVLSKNSTYLCHKKTINITPTTTAITEKWFVCGVKNKIEGSNGGVYHKKGDSVFEFICDGEKWVNGLAKNQVTIGDSTYSFDGKKWGCLDGQTSCDGRCVDLKTNYKFCGSCTTSCEKDKACVAGECVVETTCPSSDWKNVCCKLKDTQFKNFIDAQNKETTIHTDIQFKNFIDKQNKEEKLCQEVTK